MGQDDEVDFIRRDPITFHLLKEIRDMLGMAGSIRVVTSPWIKKVLQFCLIGIGPEIGIEIFFQFHPILLHPLTLTLPSRGEG